MRRRWWRGPSWAWEASSSRLWDVVVHRRYLEIVIVIVIDWFWRTTILLRQLPALKEVMTVRRIGSLCVPWCCSRSWISLASRSCKAALNPPENKSNVKRCRSGPFLTKFKRIPRILHIGSPDWNGYVWILREQVSWYVERFFLLAMPGQTWILDSYMRNGVCGVRNNSAQFGLWQPERNWFVRQPGIPHLKYKPHV